jgi:hypothetical protein
VLLFLEEGCGSRAEAPAWWAGNGLVEGGLAVTVRGRLIVYQHVQTRGRGPTQVAVRAHLDALRQDGLISAAHLYELAAGGYA